MRRAKQVEYVAISCCFASRICQLKVKILHLTVIISVSLSSTITFFTKTNGYLLVPNIGVSRSKTISFAKCDFGAGRWTIWPSSRSNKSWQGITCGDHLKSFRNITSASSAPIQAKLVVAGLVNVCKMLFSGFKRKFFPQFAGPVSNIFLYLPVLCKTALLLHEQMTCTRCPCVLVAPLPMHAIVTLAYTCMALPLPLEVFPNKTSLHAPEPWLLPFPRRFLELR